MRPIRDLDPTELRVLGALLEKEQATPDYYPMTVNALLAACNQKSNRDPVTELSEGEVLEALDSLRHDVLAWRSEGARVERWSQSISRRLELSPAQKAVLTLLMLRGPQTAGELRARSGRLHEFESVAEVEAALEELAVEDRELTVELPRQPGQKENRWSQQLSGTVDLAAVAAAAPTPRAVSSPAAAGLSQRVEVLETAVAELTETVTELRRRLGDA